MTADTKTYEAGLKALRKQVAELESRLKELEQWKREEDTLAMEQRERD